MIYCFAPQLREVSAHFPAHQIRAIVTTSQVISLELGIFVHVSPAPVRALVPEVIFETLKQRGFTLIHINEQYKRDYIPKGRK